MTKNPTRARTTALYLLLTLGLALGGALLAPTASAACTIIDGRGGDPSVDVVIVAGGCRYDGRDGTYADVNGQQVYP